MDSLQPTILIVDDEKHTRDGLRRLLEDEYDTYVAEDIRGAMDVLEREPIDVMITDLRLGGDDGMALIERALKLPHPPICIMMTAYGTVDTAVEAMKRGAYDFVTKPVNLDKVEILIARALARRKMEQENRTLRQQVDERYGLENIIGESPVLREVLDTIKQVAPSSANVLIEGESGTGKELAAQAIHNFSRRNNAQFGTVHCAALSPQLRERKEDIPLLVRSFLRHFCRVNEKPLLELTADATNALLTYSWPGNVRELRTAIEHGVVMARGSKLTLRDLPPNVRAATGAALPGGITPAKAFGEKSSALDLHETEKRLIMQALATTNGNITKAAQKLGISRRTLHRKINELKQGGALSEPPV